MKKSFILILSTLLFSSAFAGSFGGTHIFWQTDTYYHTAWSTQSIFGDVFSWNVSIDARPSASQSYVAGSVDFNLDPTSGNAIAHGGYVGIANGTIFDAAMSGGGWTAVPFSGSKNVVRGSYLVTAKLNASVVGSGSVRIDYRVTTNTPY